ncbi:MAG: tetratricopeptide repeat protein [Tannerella sp.]|jgi:tetratricopeptide (TPR) repeat protein|nr:tetratricopeptide repeat protein [Tannerella sp.]
MKISINKFLILCGLSVFTLSGFAQSLDQAKKLYNEGLYEEAKPAFERLVNQSPNNSSYCLWYGVCCYETNDLEPAEKYLQLARNRKVTEASRYLAVMYTDVYRFQEAEEMWEDYIAQLAKKNEDVSLFEQELDRVNKLRRMKERTEDVQIIDSVVVHRDQILGAYFLSEDCGSLQMSQDFFGPSRNTESTVYLNPKGDRALYAHQVFEQGYSLFTQSKLLDTWADEKAIFPADTSDNNYPFMLGDGITLYFASKGNGSIGGYDLFITSYNINSNAYLAPEQLGMPFNSPANDFMYVIDEVKKVGWFVSDRNQPEGFACVYLFIPNPSRTQITESDDDAWLGERAALTSIRDTWKESSQYDELINLAKSNISLTQKKEIRDFEFVINDKAIYYTLGEFRSPEAKSLYEKALDLKKLLKTLEVNLDKHRLTYSQGNQNVRDQLRLTILNAESELKLQLAHIGSLEKQARNIENSSY